MTYAIKAVIFDWAGTMVDFGSMAPVEAMMDAFAAHGVAVSEAEVRRDMGRAKRDHVGAILSDAAVAARWLAAKAAPPTIADIIVYLMERGVKIGSGTGYTRQTMTGVLPRAAAQGYAPQVVVCSGETPSGRPAPLMTWKALIELDAWPAWLCVKVDDAPVGIEEGRLAGCWTIGVSASGNGVGLGLDAYRALAEPDRAGRVETSARLLKAAGADYAIETVADMRPVLEDIAARIAAGDRPGRG
jgi:phosphonoacetaldehyde hydrolase